MNFLWENEKILDLVSALVALEKQIHEVSGQIAQFHRERLTEILTGRKSGMFKSPMRMKRVVLMWLTKYWESGLTARELFNMRDSLHEYSGTKFPRRVEAYSMFLGRLDKRYVRRVKEGKEFRYYITMDGARTNVPSLPTLFILDVFLSICSKRQCFLLARM